MTGFLRAGCLQCVFTKDNINSNNTGINTTASSLSSSSSYVSMSVSPVTDTSDYIATCLVTTPIASSSLSLVSEAAKNNISSSSSSSSATTITTKVIIQSCTAPAPAPAQGPGLVSTVSTGYFLFPLKVISRPVLTNVFPSSGSTQGGYMITLRGRGFTPDMDMACSFGKNTDIQIII